MHRVPAALLIGLTFALIVACADDEADATDHTTTTSTSTSAAEGVDREAILDELEEVRGLLVESAAAIPPDAMLDVAFEDSILTVMVSQDEEIVTQAEALCTDLAEAIRLTEVSIEVVDQEGARLASCEFDG